MKEGTSGVGGAGVIGFPAQDSTHTVFLHRDSMHTVLWQAHSYLILHDSEASC